MKEIKITCDLCKGTKTVQELTLQIIFLTEQNEGRATKPYFSMEKFDICKICLYKALNGNAIYGTGAMGYNDYSFKKPWDYDNYLKV